jgi:hypothetical protein
MFARCNDRGFRTVARNIGIGKAVMMAGTALETWVP